VIEYEKKRASEYVGVSIYSSNSIAWMFKESKWGDGVVRTYSTSVFLNGFMHWLELSQIVAIDMQGKNGGKLVGHMVKQSPSMKLRVSYVYVLLVCLGSISFYYGS
jgi:hypothetical protein